MLTIIFVSTACIMALKCMYSLRYYRTLISRIIHIFGKFKLKQLI